MPSTPNILFIFTDQQTINAMSCCGNPYVRTPHMDELAARGVRFTNSYCTSPVCGPSRASLITGLTPHQLGMPINGPPLPEDAVTLGHRLTEAGYDTTWVGKWHLPESYSSEPNLPGFENLPLSQELSILGDLADGPVADLAVEFLRRPHDKPFFLGVALHNPHDICYQIADIDETPLAEENWPPLPPNFDVDPAEPEFISQCRERTYYGAEITFTKDWTTAHWRNYLYRYFRFVEQVDAEIGRVIAALRETGLEDNTLILFTSDHGEGVAAHRWVVKLMLWEEVVKVPFLLSWKGVIPQGQVDSGHLVSGLDVVPTLLDYAGATAGPDLPGQSLRPLIEEAAQPGRDYLVTELHPDPKDVSRGGRMVRSHQFKYVVFSHGHHPELFFDLKADPGERMNLARIPAMREELENHRRLLKQWLVQTQDNFQAQCFV